MKADREQQVNQLLSAALEHPPSERTAFLADACAEDEDLLHEVESLLLKNQAAATLIQPPPASIPAEGLATGKAPALTAGNQLGPYKVLSRIGAGGMGEVFLAQDTRLGRKVALKLLPAALVADDELKRRFVREARAASALNHPNIITIFDIGSDDGRDFIAMEFVEGESLSSVIAHGKVELKRALGLIAQCAAGLAAAHGAGIVHRDIKPDNLMVSPDGHVKILDFGLAKLSERQGPESLNSNLSTFIGSEEPQGGTKPGVILGTVVYMSPEQAQGRPLDPRTDIFSLGVVLYEMLAAKRPFQGNSAVDVLHAIINREPRSVLEVNPNLPAEVAEILAKALAKDASERYQHVGDFGLDLRRLKREIESNTLQNKHTTQASHIQATRFGLKWAVISAIAVLASVIGGWWLGRSSGPISRGSSLENVTLKPLTTDPGYEGEPTFSPNGETVAYVSDRTGDFEIYIQQVSGGTYRNITENKADDVQPSYSPDGQQIAFVSTRLSPSGLRYEGYDLPLMGGDIWVTPVLGGNARRVAQKGCFPSWSPDGSSIIYIGGPAFGQKILRVDARGSEPREIVPKIKPEPRFLLYPSYSADERWIVFEADPAVLGSFGFRDIWAMRAETGELQFIAKGQNPSWSADSEVIIYSSAEPGKNFSLWQVPFSTTEGKVSGPAQPLTVSRGRDSGARMSRDGRQIAFAGTETSFNVETVAFDAEAGRVLGSPEEITSGRTVSYFQSIAPDDKTVVFESRQGEGTHLWKTERGAVPVELTSDPHLNDTFPRWSPDGKSIAFNRKSNGAGNSLWLMTDDGANPRLVSEKAGNFAWMADGRGLVYASSDDMQLYLVDLASGSSRRLTNEPKIVQILTTSPDGKWVIYQTLQSGNIDLRAISVSGGEPLTVVATPHQDYHPFVSPSGRWLYFQLDHKNIYRVPGPEQNWRQAAPEKMTDFPESGLLLEDPQISRDGKKLLYSRGRILGDIWIMKLRQ